MRRPLRALGHIFSGRGKSPPRRAAELSVFVAAASVVIYGLHGAPLHALIIDALVWAAFGFGLGAILSALFDRRELVDWYRGLRTRRP